MIEKDHKPRTDPMWEWELRMALAGAQHAKRMEESLSDASGMDVYVEVIVHVEGAKTGIIVPSDIEEYSYMPVMEDL